MKDTYALGVSSVRPDSYSYTGGISAFAASTYHKRGDCVSRAFALLGELQDAYKKSGDDPRLRPHLTTYNTIVNA